MTTPLRLSEGYSCCPEAGGAREERTHLINRGADRRCGSYHGNAAPVVVDAVGAARCSSQTGCLEGESLRAQNGSGTKRGGSRDAS
jgi:hypothetical protein